MSEKLAISVRGLSKRYRLGVRNYKFLLNDLFGSGGSEEDKSVFWALKDLDFDLAQGEVLGVIGKNGAGKSTLLKLLSRITGPSSGSISVNGSIASLLEVGTGFHPEMTGRENVFLNGAILGLRHKQIADQFDAIVDFAGVEKYIDTPVKRYSSGMYVRLAFAVAAHLEPDILIVDEVLAVGDAEFQKRCLGRMQEAAGEGRTVIFVSHNLNSVKTLCDRALYLKQGRLVMDGTPEACISSYLEGDRLVDVPLEVQCKWQHPIQEISAILCNGKPVDLLELSDPFPKIDIRIKGSLKEAGPLHLNCRICDDQGIPLAFYTPEQGSSNMEILQAGAFDIEERIQLPSINEGKYQLNIYLTDPRNSKDLMSLESVVQIQALGTPNALGWTYKYRNGNGFHLLNRA